MKEKCKEAGLVVGASMEEYGHGITMMNKSSTVDKAFE